MPKMPSFKPSGAKAPKLLAGSPPKITKINAPPKPRVPTARTLDSEMQTAINHVTKLHKEY